MSELLNDLDQEEIKKRILQEMYDEFIRNGVDNEKIMKSFQETYGDDTKVINDFKKKHSDMTFDEFSRYDFLLNLKKNFKIGYLSGYLEDIVKFPKEKVLEVAKVLRKDGMNFDDIMEITKLTIEDLRTLKNGQDG